MLSSHKVRIAVITSSGWMMCVLFIGSSVTHTSWDTTHEEESPIPDHQTLRDMKTPILETFYHRYVSSPQTSCSMVERMGSLEDGGWDICLDPRYAPDPTNCLVYSFGIKDDFSYDDAMAAYGCEVHSFDPSMTNSSDHLRGERVYFHREGVGEQDGVIQRYNGLWQIFTVGTFRNRLGHTQIKRRLDVLKMDVEGDERKSLLQALADGSMDDVRQLSVELHRSNHKSMYISNLEVLRACYEHGFRIYMSNRNPLCQFVSEYTKAKRTECHELYMVNVNIG